MKITIYDDDDSVEAIFEQDPASGRWYEKAAGTEGLDVPSLLREIEATVS